jgi:hypothetical protein
MSQPVGKVPLKEKNNYPQGKSGSKVKTISGPAVGTPAVMRRRVEV